MGVLACLGLVGLWGDRKLHQQPCVGLLGYGSFGICDVGFFPSDWVVEHLEYLRGIGHRVFWAMVCGPRWWSGRCSPGRRIWFCQGHQLPLKLRLRPVHNMIRLHEWNSFLPVWFASLCGSRRIQWMGSCSVSGIPFLDHLICERCGCPCLSR